ncbi:MAG TPA: hypothetical protein VFD46_08355 [Chryseolinea sp.]|nr:hypothetical protein [Chryseolinea sp.]
MAGIYLRFLRFFLEVIRPRLGWAPCDFGLSEFEIVIQADDHDTMFGDAKDVMETPIEEQIVFLDIDQISSERE